MEIHQLEYFVAVAEDGNFTRAAARLHVAQPGVSAQIKRLERELGEPLLDRSARVVVPTAVGAEVLVHAKAALDAVAAMRSTVDDFAGLVRGRVTIGMLSSATAGDVDLPSLLADFHRDYPDVEITLAEDHARGLIDSVRTGRVDVAFTAVGAMPDDLETITVRNERIVAAVGPGHVLDGRRSIRLADLLEHRLISMPRGSGLRAILDDACARIGLTPTIAYEAGNPLVACQLAAVGLGVAIVPESAPSIDPALHAIGVVGPVLSGSVIFAWRASGPMSPAARAFVAKARIAIQIP